MFGVCWGQPRPWEDEKTRCEQERAVFSGSAPSGSDAGGRVGPGMSSSRRVTAAQEGAGCAAHSCETRVAARSWHQHRLLAALVPGQGGSGALSMA